jgi:hypothetical protein
MPNLTTEIEPSGIALELLLSLRLMISPPSPPLQRLKGISEITLGIDPIFVVCPRYGHPIEFADL